MKGIAEFILLTEYIIILVSFVPSIFWLPFFLHTIPDPAHAPQMEEMKYSSYSHRHRPIII